MWQLISNQNINDSSITTLAMEIPNVGCMVMVIVGSMQPTLTFVQGAKVEGDKLIFAWEDKIDGFYGPDNTQYDDAQYDDDDDDDYEDWKS
jgi:hypothetical protein